MNRLHEGLEVLRISRFSSEERVDVGLYRCLHAANSSFEPPSWGRVSERFRQLRLGHVEVLPPEESADQRSGALTYRYSGRDFRPTDVHGRVIHDIIA